MIRLIGQKGFGNKKYGNHKTIIPLSPDSSGILRRHGADIAYGGTGV